MSNEVRIRSLILSHICDEPRTQHGCWTGRTRSPSLRRMRRAVVCPLLPRRLSRLAGRPGRKVRESRESSHFRPGPACAFRRGAASLTHFERPRKLGRRLPAEAALFLARIFHTSRERFSLTPGFSPVDRHAAMVKPFQRLVAGPYKLLKQLPGRRRVRPPGSSPGVNETVRAYEKSALGGSDTGRLPIRRHCATVQAIAPVLRLLIILCHG